MDRTMGELALGLYLVFLVVAFGLRTVLHRRRTGSTGFHGVSGRPGSPEWFAGVLFVAAVVLGLLAPAAQLARLLTPIAVLDGWAVRIVGGMLAITGIVATVTAQQAMGASWRIGVDRQETTTLITSGPFALARNPIFTAMITAVIGLMLLAPNALALAALVALIVGVQLQVRVVEEAYLLRTHGEVYLTYAGRVGRFLPGIGRLTHTALSRPS